MNKLLFSIPVAVGLVLAGCGSDNGGNQVISKRYIHKYGYAVSDSEWNANNYPGQVITTLRNGVTITATFEDGRLHGPTTHTHPHSQTVQYYFLYNAGDLKKEVVYDSLGMPIQEKLQLSPHRHCLTTWFGDGTPKSIEDYAGEELLDGQYFSLNNELESRVERGIGLRTLRDVNGLLLAKDEIDKGYVIQKDEFYASGAPRSITHYFMNQKHGERRAFTENGDPLAVEEWVDDLQHGKATYFNNGKKQIEVYFVNGARNGVETHFIDGEIVEQEIHWAHDKRHGPTKFFVGNAVAKTEWYYGGASVSQKRFDELHQMDQMITHASAVPGEKGSSQ